MQSSPARPAPGSGDVPGHQKWPLRLPVEPKGEEGDCGAVIGAAGHAFWNPAAGWQSELPGPKTLWGPPGWAREQLLPQPGHFPPGGHSCVLEWVPGPRHPQLLLQGRGLDPPTACPPPRKTSRRGLPWGPRAPDTLASGRLPALRAGGPCDLWQLLGTGVLDLSPLCAPPILCSSVFPFLPLERLQSHCRDIRDRRSDSLCFLPS